MLQHSHFSGIHILCLIKGEMCHFCVTSVSKVSLVSFFGHVSRTHLPVCHWLDKLKPLVEPLLLFLLAGLNNSFSVSGIKTNANKWCYPWVQFKFTEYNDFQRKQSINGEFRIPLNTGLAYKKIFLNKNKHLAFKFSFSVFLIVAIPWVMILVPANLSRK